MLSIQTKSIPATNNEATTKDDVMIDTNNGVINEGKGVQQFNPEKNDDGVLDEPDVMVHDLETGTTSTLPAEIALNKDKDKTKQIDCNVPSLAEQQAKLKAAARAYALSGTTSKGKNYKQKLLLQSPGAAYANLNTNANAVVTTKKPRKFSINSTINLSLNDVVVVATKKRSALQQHLIAWNENKDENEQIQAPKKPKAKKITSKAEFIQLFKSLPLNDFHTVSAMAEALEVNWTTFIRYTTKYCVNLEDFRLVKKALLELDKDVLRGITVRPLGRNFRPNPAPAPVPAS